MDITTWWPGRDMVQRISHGSVVVVVSCLLDPPLCAEHNKNAVLLQSLHSSLKYFKIFEQRFKVSFPKLINAVHLCK